MTGKVTASRTRTRPCCLYQAEYAELTFVDARLTAILPEDVAYL